jgi:hypothetical protein
VVITDGKIKGMRDENPALTAAVAGCIGDTINYT